MKQRITVGQLNKLTDAQKEHLREWWTPQLGDFCLSTFGGRSNGKEVMIVIFDKNLKLPYLVGGESQPFHYVHASIVNSTSNELIPIMSLYPLLNIGQMIQFIQEKKPALKGISKNRFDKWFINIETAQLGYKDELCDSLWEATTQILKAV